MMLSSLGDSRAISFILHANAEVEDIMSTSTCHAEDGSRSNPHNIINSINNNTRTLIFTISIRKVGK
ncbi:hypothetical protein [Sulfuracidifex metallicus]|uniref:hypothetical protein n=1 Tax=Sulfuracidifex metallicus TaxID=47303 RepID=UPI002275C0AF|nr:hypothetical protein [Sulfuracidifex metallicus]MCY0850647.1 hypothetical protein [Sulfuracidifex metallicus]